MAKWPLSSSLGLVVPIFLSLSLIVQKLHYSLPAPNVHQYDPLTKEPVLSEAVILEYSRQLSEDIGYRTVGTREHALADAWMLAEANKLKELCEKKVQEGRKLECEVWRQEGSGSHRFDMMGKRVYKTYKGLTNIVMRISNGTSEGKEHALLVNSHLDSTLPSPGAADDALSVGVMIETARVLLDTSHWEPKHAVIFLWNHAEESLQDGSHLYSTQHETAPTVNAVINLEAAGTTGPSLLFQATSEEMIKAYSHVPRPHGTVMANDIFSSGFLLSDTDFRQFEYYLNVTGLDMAIVGNSYVYHTRLDIVANIEAGAAQHMADQTLALIKYLTSAESEIASLKKSHVGRPTAVYFSILGRYFFMYSASMAVALTLILLTSSLALAYAVVPKLSLGNLLKATYAVISAIVGALVASNFVALFMKGVLNKPLSWFSNELAPVVLYGPPALTGALISQLILPFARPTERTLLAGVLVSQALVAAIMQTVFKIGSSQVLLVTALSQFAGLLYAHITEVGERGGRVRLSTYLVSQLFPLAAGAEILFAVSDFFVPLTGRIGDDAPAEHIIASMIAVIGSISLPTTVAFFTRFPKSALKSAIKSSSILTILAVIFFSMKDPFDVAHPKRVFILHSENVTSGYHHLHISAADAAPHFDTLVQNIADELTRVNLMNATTRAVLPTSLDERNGDWDVLYPFSAFLTPYKLPIYKPLSYSSQWELTAPPDGQFRVVVANEAVDQTKRTRKLDLVVHHPGLIWSVIAFDAEVVHWSLDNNPPPEYSRHWIREGSFYGISQYELHIEVKLPEGADSGYKIPINFMAVREDSMYPGKLNDARNVSVNGELHHAMSTLELLDQFLDISTEKKVDVLLMGCVGGLIAV